MPGRSPYLFQIPADFFLTGRDNQDYAPTASDKGARHTGAANYAMCDGHVKYLRGSSVVPCLYSTDTGFVVDYIPDM